MLIMTEEQKQRKRLNFESLNFYSSLAIHTQIDLKYELFSENESLLKKLQKRKQKKQQENSIQNLLQIQQLLAKKIKVKRNKEIKLILQEEKEKVN
jgi:hypothetical protein